MATNLEVIHREYATAQRTLADARNALGESRLRIATVGETGSIAVYYGDRAGKNQDIKTLLLFAAAASSSGSPSKAANLYEEAMALANKRQDRRAEVVCFLGIGDELRYMANMNEAFSVIQHALTIADEIKDNKLIGASYSRLGAILLNDEPQRALEYYTKALKILSSETDLNSRAIVLSNLGTVYLQLGRYQEAQYYSAQAERIFRQLGSRGEQPGK